MARTVPAAVRTVHVLASRADRSGGAEVYTRELVIGLNRRGYDVTLVCHEADGDASDFCRVCVIPRPRIELPVLWRVGPILQLAAVAQHMTAIPLDEPDVVVGMAQLLTWAHGRRFPRAPLAYVPHALLAPREVGGYRWTSIIQRRSAVMVSERMERRAIERAFRTVRFTDRARDVFSTHYRAIGGRYQVIPQAVAVPDRVPPKAWTAPLRLLSIGRLVESKNNERLLRTLGGLASLDWTLDVVGDGDQRQALERLTWELGLAARVRFHGHQTDVGEWYSRSHLVVSCSRLENAPLIILEAMAHGVPSLTIAGDGATYVNANDELVIDGDNGFLASSETEFAATLAALIASPGRLAGAGRRARLTAQTNHSWTRHLDAYEALFSAARTAGGPH